MPLGNPAGYLDDSEQLEPEQQAKLNVALQEVMMQKLAEHDQGLAQSRIEATNIEMGTVTGPNQFAVPKGGRVIAQSKNIKKVDDGVFEIVPTTNTIERPLNTVAIVNKMAKGLPAFDIDAEFNKLRTIDSSADKEQLAQQLFVHLGQSAASVQERIRTIAAQRAGVNDAQAALDKNIALDNAAVQMGRIRPGDTTIQTQNAQKTYQTALATANQLETDLLKKDPDIAKYNDYRALLVNELKSIERLQAKEADRDARLPVLTDERLQNAAFALGIKTENTSKFKNTIANTMLKDRALVAVADINKNNLPKYLVDPDANVRRYAFNILAKSERIQLGLDETAELPKYVKDLQKLVNDPTALLSSSDKTRLETAKSKVIGEKAKTEEGVSFLLKNITKRIERETQDKYQRMDTWLFSDPQLKAIVEQTRGADPKGQLLMSDGVDAVVKAKMKRPDGSEMTIDEKINMLTKSLQMSMENDKESIILPSSQNYLPVLATELRNETMKSFMRNNPVLTFETFLPQYIQAKAIGAFTREAFELGIGEARGAQDSQQPGNQVPASVEEARGIVRNYEKAYQQGFKFGSKRLDYDKIQSWAEQAKVAKKFLDSKNLSY